MDVDTIRQGVAAAEVFTPSQTTGWPEPQSLAADSATEPYPVEALPGVLRAAILEVQAFVQAPTSLVAGSALAALSITAQGHVDVQRAAKLVGPSSLFLLTVADSGERKTTCDGLFLAAIREWERQEPVRLEPELQGYRAALAV